MKDIFILAIESSCDETSMAIVKNGKQVISLVINTQMDVHANYGGVVPEIASRMHTENITLVLEETLKKIKIGSLWRFYGQCVNKQFDGMSIIEMKQIPKLIRV